jgi:hypothetical protein
MHTLERHRFVKAYQAGRNARNGSFSRKTRRVAMKVDVARQVEDHFWWRADVSVHDYRRHVALA